MSGKCRSTTSEDQLPNAELTEDLPKEHAFVANLACCVRTSLNSILGFAQLSQRDAQQPVSERQQRRIEQILEEGARLLSVLDEVLELVSVEASSPLDLETVSLREILRETAATVEPFAARAGVRVSELTLPEEVRTVVAERARLARILTIYAVISIAVGGGDRLTFGASMTDEHVRLAVSGNGRAFSDAVLDRLFEPFFVVADADSGVQGSGLGLAIARALAGSMGGGVGCRSLPSGGSEFWLDLPIRDSTARSGTRPALHGWDLDG